MEYLSWTSGDAGHGRAMSGNKRMIAEARRMANWESLAITQSATPVTTGKATNRC